MPAKILQSLFHRVEMSKCEAAVLQAILSKANIYGKHAQVSILCLMAISGYQRRQTQYAVKGLATRGLLHVDRRKIRFGYNAINVYHVVVPWRFDALAPPSVKPYWSRPKSPRALAVRPSILEGEKPSSAPVSEDVATRLWTRGSYQWYACQGLEPPEKEGI